MILAKPSKYIEARRKGRTAQCAESRYRENLCPDDGTFLQEYFVYFKKKWLTRGVNCPADAAGVLCAAALIEKFTITLPEIDSLCYNAISVYNR